MIIQCSKNNLLLVLYVWSFTPFSFDNGFGIYTQHVLMGSIYIYSVVVIGGGNIANTSFLEGAKLIQTLKPKLRSFLYHECGRKHVL